MLTDELRYKLLKALEVNPNLSQRAVSTELGISLGKVNYCINALMEVGLLKAQNFKNSQNKLKYVYVLTPKGLEEKANVTKRFLASKIEEVELLRDEIEQLRKEMDSE
jgi:EPS-associated MarR family transcriptional regulator